ncbi:twin-arginine translocase TatA/TatE family subunit [Paenibacillaceae bacterium]|nr:twin-arginine translocase TatA/TatE family subunit [Paenibacillaceae bacterium]
MPNLGVSGIILLVIVALLLFGPNKLPELGRAAGRTLREFKNGARDLMDDEKPQDKKKADAVEVQSDERTNTKRLPD